MRGIGPLRMTRREVNRAAVTAGLRRGHGVHTGCTEVEGNTVTSTYFCAPLYFITDPPGKLGCLPTVKNPEKIPLICY